MKKEVTSEEIREVFLRFFIENKHQQISGASVIPVNDPTLLFINSGMAPLKRYFVGEDTPPHPDLCNIQPCIRTNDIDDVGDRHHMTFFEMLGSWSINNYFKDKAIELACQLLVERFGFSLEGIYATVYAGDPALDLPADEESARAWEKVGMPRDHIVFLGEDNFWGPAGDHGPCGPCTEVFFDTGSEHGPEYHPGGFFDTTRYIEIWNAGVFMELDKRPDGTFAKLPFHSVDTGSGLERMAMALNRYDNVYETDPMRPIRDAVRQQLGGRDVSEAVVRRLTDHLRASFFIMAEGVLPANEGRGYIPRRLIRKCIATTAQEGVSEFDFRGLLELVGDQIRQSYPSIGERTQETIDAFLAEKAKFDAVAKRGLERLHALCKDTPFLLSGTDAFTLVSTYGLPLELIREFVAERKGQLDESGFAAEFEKHQEISRASKTQVALGESASVLGGSAGSGLAPTVFTGYETTRGDAEARVLALIGEHGAVERAGEGDTVAVVVDRTPFYAEGGGQVGDRGLIETDDAGVVVVEDCIKPDKEHFLHSGKVTRGTISVGESVRLCADEELRQRTAANHSGTHLLQKALRSVLGDHVKQRGSQVDPNRLRFDFEHPSRIEADQLVQIERLANQLIRQNLQRTTEVVSYDEAITSGALAFFEDTYGDEVRVVRFGSASAELCGGTHVRYSGEIGLLRIVSEGSVASGVRRLVAVTGEEALDYTQQRESVLRCVTEQLGVGAGELSSRIKSLIERSSGKASEEPAQTLDLDKLVWELPDGTRCLCTRVDEDIEQLRARIFDIAEKIGGVVCLVSGIEDKVRIAIAVNRKRTDVYLAKNLLLELLPIIDGKGGGSKTFAQGGGGSLQSIEEVLSSFPDVVRRQSTGSTKGSGPTKK